MIGLRALVLGVIVVFTQQIASALSTPELGFESPKRRCWVFAHQNKSGGTSVKKMLKVYIRNHHDDVTEDVYDSDQWKWGNDYAQRFVQASNNITWGGYTEALRSHETRDCQWFTMFRQ